MASNSYAVLRATDVFLYNNINKKDATAENINKQIENLSIETCNYIYGKEIRMMKSKSKLIEKSRNTATRHLTLVLTESEMESRYPSWLYSRYKWKKGKSWTLVDNLTWMPITMTLDEQPTQQLFELANAQDPASLTTSRSSTPPEVPTKSVNIRPFKFRDDLPTKYAVEGQKLPESLILYTHPVRTLAKPPPHTYIKFENGRYYANYEPNAEKTLDALISTYKDINN